MRLYAVLPVPTCFTNGKEHGEGGAVAAQPGYTALTEIAELTRRARLPELRLGHRLRNALPLLSEAHVYLANEDKALYNIIKRGPVREFLDKAEDLFL